MSFSWKIFITTFLITVLSFGIGGFVLLNHVFQTTLNALIDAELTENKFFCTSLNTLVEGGDSPISNYNIRQFQRQLTSGNRIIINDKKSLKHYENIDFIDSLLHNQQGSCFFEENGEKYIQVISRLDINRDIIYIESVKNISSVFDERESLYNFYRLLLLGVALSSSVILMIFSHLVTFPLSSLTKTVREISSGHYSKRVKSPKLGTATEIVELTKNFNSMAESVEQNIKLLKDHAKKQEDFVGNFTHELKTPLTSIIGYADMIRSGELPPEIRRLSADYIYREGKRLESLSLHLLNLIVVRNNEIELINRNSDEFFGDVKKSLLFTVKKYSMNLLIECDKATLHIEPMLIKTVVLNLVENSCKASVPGESVVVGGKLTEDGYVISVSDHGCGIPEDEIFRITEAFYMVDKSRARENGSAGLGLALCEEILKLHHTNLSIESSLGQGTTMSFSVEVENETD